MNYPLRLPEQLKPHLRALRKSRGLTQAQLGALVGVKQARIAEIEAHPGAVSLDQLVKVLAALGATLHLHAADAHAAEAAASAPKAVDTGARPGGKASSPPTDPQPKARTSRKAASPRAGVAIRANKGTW